MSQLDHSLLDQVMQLPFDQRSELVDRLLESIHPAGENISGCDLNEAWLTELQARMSESEAGIAGVPAEEVWKKLDARRRARSTG